MFRMMNKRIIIYFFFVCIGLSMPVVFHICAKNSKETIDYTKSDLLANAFQENYLMLYYEASDADLSAVLDPNSNVPQVLKETIKNYLKQYCDRVNENPKEYFSYRILDADGKEIASNRSSDQGQSIIKLIVDFDKDGKADYILNGEQQPATTPWAVPTGIDGMQNIYEQLTQPIYFESIGIYEMEQQEDIKSELFEGLRRPLPANVTYEIFIDSSSMYIAEVDNQIYSQYAMMQDQYFIIFLIIVAVLGAVFILHGDGLLIKKKMFFIGRSCPFYIQCFLLSTSFIITSNTLQSIGIWYFSWRSYFSLLFFGLLMSYVYVNFLLVLKNFDQNKPCHFLCQYSVFVRILKKAEDKDMRWICFFEFIAILFLSLISLIFIYQGVIGIALWVLCNFIFSLAFAKTYSIIIKEKDQIAWALTKIEPLARPLQILSFFEECIKQNQQLFKKAIDEEIRSQRMKSELITNVSHDLKTPLTSIRGYVDLLKQEQLTSQQKLYVEKMGLGVYRLTTLVEDLFDISRAESGNLHLQLEAVRLEELIRQVILEHEHDLAEKGLHIRFEGFGHLVIVNVDSEKTHRIFDNLIRNCVKYAMTDTRIYIVLIHDADQASICIKNVSAYEISFDARDILERFVRGDAARTSEGSGLGLAIVRSFAQAQHGDFHVEVDGDLFKAIISFPLMKTKEEDREESIHETRFG